MDLKKMLGACIGASLIVVIVGIVRAHAGHTTLHFTITNSGSAPAKLVSITGLGTVRWDDEITLSQHTSVPVEAELSNLTADLRAGDVVELILNFDARSEITVTFDVLNEAPTRRLNFSANDDFQVSNAWIEATVTAETVVESTSDYAWNLPAKFPPPRVPDNNPMTAEKVELGRYLFYDERLAGNGTQSCGSCHQQELAFTDGLALPAGSTGDIHPRNAMTLTNAAYNATLTWANPNLQVLERQIPIPMFGEHPVELGITGYEDEVLHRFREDAQYQALFAAAFPGEGDPFSFQNITFALSSFTRTLISGDSAYDRYVGGDRMALSESAQRGMSLFFGEALECHHCHTGFNFTLSTVSANSTFDERPFFNTGMYNVDGEGAYPPGNTGIHEITNDPQDMGRFRPPTLRNIALTAPYMHDGSVATLEDVVQFYVDGGRVIETGELAGDGRANPFKSGLVPGFTLTSQETADLVAFLQSLTDESFVTDPRFSDPFKLANEG